jgi:uncharacterized alkaline shock family protein YloU
MEGHSVISTELLGSYAADAACEVAGVTGLVESPLHRHRGVRVTEEGDGVTVELHLAVEWGASIPRVGAEARDRVAAYLERMADVAPRSVEVTVDEVGPPPAP